MSFGRFRGRIVPAYIVVIMLLFVVSPMILLRGIAHATPGQLQSRFIQMSDDTTNTSGSTASYLVQFNVATTGTVQAIVVDICASDPIPGDNCTLPTGYVAAATFSPGTNTASGWSASVANTNRTFELSNASGGSRTAGDTMSFTMTGVTNPTTAATFYGRIFTFATTAAATTFIGFNSGNGNSTSGYTDYGGIALAVTQPILVTSKVQEQLTFCVYQTSCGTQANILLGDTNDVLSTTLPAVDKHTLYSLSTNASHGAIVYLKGATLTSGGNTIPAAGATSFTWSAGADFFGLCTYNSTLTVGSAPTVVTEYAGAGASGTCSGTSQDAGTTLVTTAVGSPNPATFGFNSTNTLGTFGDQIASIAAPGASVNTVVLAASVSVTQASGVYTTTLQLIAVGTY